jgi:hypothetical protein
MQAIELIPSARETIKSLLTPLGGDSGYTMTAQTRG